MENIKSSLSVTNTVDNGKPNILKRKTNEKVKSTSSYFDNSQSLLIPSALISSSSVTSFNSFENELNPPYCFLLPDEVNTKFKDSQSTDIFSTQQLQLNKKEERSNHTRRRPSQKIILDTYICDKNRYGKKSTEDKLNKECNETQYVYLQNIKSSLPTKHAFIQDANTMEANAFQICAEPDVSAMMEVNNVANYAGSGPDNCKQINTLSTHSIIVDANLESGQVVQALHDNGVPQGQLLLLSDDQGATRQMWLCPLTSCNTLFSDKTVLDSHILSHFDLKTFMCNINKCNKTYISEDKLKEHQGECRVLADDTTNIEPPSSSTTTTTEYWEEVKRKARHLVSEALVSVGVTEDMMQSVILEDGSRGWPCFLQECDLAFQTQYMLKNHLLAHHDLRPFKCSHQGCEWAFRSLAKLRVHSEIHSGVRKHVCSEPGCSKTFSSKSNLTLHISKVHGDGNVILTCPSTGCLETFTDKSKLKDHVNSLHSDNKCDVCGKKFWMSSKLIAHSRVHMNSAELQCSWPGCGGLFTQPSRLRYHQRSHTGDKPYRCTFPSCFWAFPSASKLRRHARAHAGSSARKFVCTICSSAFLRSEHLREHQLRHSPRRQYMCDIPGCGETFANKSTVYVHKKRDHISLQPGKVRANRKAVSTKLLVNPEDVQPTTSLIEEPNQMCSEDTLSLRSARTHVPWRGCQYRILPGADIQNVAEKTIMQEDCHILQHHSGVEEKQGNPLVCGGLDLEGGDEMVADSSVGAELCLGDTDVTQQGVHLNINSLLMQEELSEGMLYTTEDDSALHVLLLNEEPPP